MPDAVRTFKKKYDGRSKSPWEGVIIEHHDSWLAVYFAEPPDWKGRPRGTRHAITFYSTNQPLCVLVALDAGCSPLQYQCDAGLPAVLEGADLSFVDLELDIIADSSLDYYLRDEEEFAANSDWMEYPEDVVAAAWQGIRIAEALITKRAFPFDGSAERLAREAQ